MLHTESGFVCTFIVLLRSNIAHCIVHKFASSIARP